MEKVEPRPEVAPLRFPDFSLMVSYADALYYVQRRLKLLGQGNLKPFCAAQQLTYTNVVNLKNGNLKREEPRLVQRLLRSLDVPNELVRFPPESPGGSYILADARALAAFQSQVAYFKSGE